MPATALSKDRLAFARIMADTDVYRFQAGHSSVPVVASTFLDAETRFSPDGSRIAFGSMRSGGIFAIWLAAADGSGAQPLAHGPRWYAQGSPWWSPDGHRIALMRSPMIGTLTSGSSTQTVAHRVNSRTTLATRVSLYWSRDGQWIYFSADRGSGRDIWRVAAKGAVTTRDPRRQAVCSAASRPTARVPGTSRRTPTRHCWRCHSPEETSRELVACVKAAAFATGPEGLYYVACDSSPDRALHVIERQSAGTESSGG